MTGTTDPSDHDAELDRQLRERLLNQASNDITSALAKLRAVRDRLGREESIERTVGPAVYGAGTRAATPAPEAER